MCRAIWSAELAIVTNDNGLEKKLKLSHSQRCPVPALSYARSLLALAGSQELANARSDLVCVARQAPILVQGVWRAIYPVL